MITPIAAEPRKPGRYYSRRGTGRTLDAPIEKLYWKIGEVAALLLTSPSRIRFYEQAFCFGQGKRDNRGQRMFVAWEIERLNLIVKLTKHCTLWGVKNLLDSGKAVKVLRAIEEETGEAIRGEKNG